MDTYLNKIRLGVNNHITMNDDFLTELIRTSVDSGMVYDIATVVHNLLKDVYRVAKLKSRLWYTFDGVKWKTVEAGPYYDLSRIILKHYESYKQKRVLEKTSIEQLLETPQFECDLTTNSEKLSQIESDIVKVQNIITKLKNVSFKESVCKECLYMFYDSHFLTNLDKKEHLVCFRDCIYDINKKIVVESKNTDMLSIYIDLDYYTLIVNNSNVDIDEIIDKYTTFRKTIVKRRRPNHIYSVKLYH